MSEQKGVSYEAGPPMEKRTAGQVATDLMQRDVYGDITAGERMQEMLSEYERGVIDAVNSGKNSYTGSDFFIVALTKREQLMQNIIRNYFIPRKSCPTPQYDQTVYRYVSKDDRLDMLWTLPSIAAIQNLLAHKHELDPSFFQLLQFVLDFLDGKLEKLAQVLNNEHIGTSNPISLKKEMVNDGRIQAGGNSGRG